MSETEIKELVTSFTNAYNSAELDEMTRLWNHSVENKTYKGIQSCLEEILEHASGNGNIEQFKRILTLRTPEGPTVIVSFVKLLVYAISRRQYTMAEYLSTLLNNSHKYQLTLLIHVIIEQAINENDNDKCAFLLALATRKDIDLEDHVKKLIVKWKLGMGRGLKPSKQP